MRGECLDDGDWHNDPDPTLSGGNSKQQVIGEWHAAVTLSRRNRFDTPNARSGCTITHHPLTIPMSSVPRLGGLQRWVGFLSCPGLELSTAPNRDLLRSNRARPDPTRPPACIGRPVSAALCVGSEARMLFYPLPP
jgi:hypothetical protein